MLLKWRRGWLVAFVFLFLGAQLGSVNGAAFVFNTFGSGESRDDNNEDFVASTPNLEGIAYQFVAAVAAPDGVRLRAALSKHDANEVVVTLDLWTDNSGLPGTSLQTKTVTLTTVNPNTIQEDFLSLSAGLVQSSTYWVSFTYSSGVDARADWQLEDQTINSNIAVRDTSSDDWRAATGTGIDPPANGLIGAFSLTPVPEPEEYALVMSVGLLGLVAFRSARGRKRLPQT